MRRAVSLLLIILILAALSACNLQTAATTAAPNADDVATRVAATLQSLWTPTNPSAPLASPTAGAPAAAATETSSGPTETSGPTATSSIPGSISGSVIGYPYGAVPALSFVAFGQDSSSWFWWANGAGQTSFSTDNFILPGKYLVVAYDHSGHAGGCPGVITVTSNTDTSCDVSNWAGSFPAKPASVP